MASKAGMFLEKKVARKCGCPSGDSQYFAGLSYLGYVHLFCFNDFARKLEFCWNTEKQSGQLFADNFELDSYKRKVT